MRAQLCPILCDPMDYILPGSLFMEFSKQGYWSGLPFSTPGDLPNPGIETECLCVSCIGRWILYHYVTWEVLIYIFKLLYSPHPQ